MKYFLYTFLALALTGCFLRSRPISFLAERNLYLPKQHGPAVERLDTIDGNPVVITEYREAKGYVYSRSVKLSDVLQADTFYYSNGRYYS